MRSHLGHIGAGEDEPAGGRVLLHGAPEAVLGLTRQPVHLIQQEHLVAALPLKLQRPVLAHVLRMQPSHLLGMHMTKYSIVQSTISPRYMLLMARSKTKGTRASA